MGRRVDDEPVVRLWCFASPALAPLVPDINKQYRWARMYQAKEIRPSWASSFSGDAFVLCESSGIYNGALGRIGKGLTGPPAVELIQKYRKKYPKWSEDKIRRAVDESIAKERREEDTVRGAVGPGELFSFFNALCEVGPVVLVLSDGGTMASEIGGTHGVPASARQPRHDEAYTILLRDATGTAFALLLFWVPVTVVRDCSS